MAKKSIKRFGESFRPPIVQWYETEQGERVLCTEKTINTLWKNWINSPKAERADTKEFTIFVFSEPTEFYL